MTNKRVLTVVVDVCCAVTINCVVVNASETPDAKAGKATGMQEVADEAAKYYEWLFSSKESKGSERLLSLLRKKQLSKRTRNAIEGKISATEVKDAIFASATESIESGRASGTA